MKIVSRISAILIASGFALSVNMRSAQANPAVLAPAALCGTGVGCVLVGAVVIAGATYYLWEYGGGKRVLSDLNGRIFQWRPVQDEIIASRKECDDYGRRLGVRAYWDASTGICFVQEY